MEPQEQSPGDPSSTAEETQPKSSAGQSVPFRNPRKSKPTQVLPSDRVSCDKQLEALRAFCAAYDAKAEPVTNDEAGKIINMSGQTIVVTNAFFVDLGLLVRTDGKFSPGAAALDYQRAYVWDANTAGVKLDQAVRETWFSKALVPRLQMRPHTKGEAIAVLAEACKASPEYQSRLAVLLDFANAAGVVSLAGDEVRIGSLSGPPADAPAPPRNEGGGGGGDDGKHPPSPHGMTIPADAPFIYVDPAKTKKVILIAPSSSVTQKEFDRIKTWFELQFFVEEAGQ